MGAEEKQPSPRESDASGPSGTHATREPTRLPVSPPDPPEPPRRRNMLPSGFTTLRDVLSFILGVGIICNEVFLQPTVEPASIAVGIALVGLPLALGADERKKGGGG